MGDWSNPRAQRVWDLAVDVIVSVSQQDLFSVLFDVLDAQE